MTPTAFAWRSLTRDRPRMLLGIAGIAAVAALLLDMLLLSRGLLLSFRSLLESTGYDVRVTASDSLPGLGPPILDSTETGRIIAQLKEVEEVITVRFGRAWTPTPAGERRRLSILAAAPVPRGEWTLVAGSNLVMDSVRPEAVISRGIADELGLEPGGILPVRVQLAGSTSVLPPVPLQVVGVAEFPFDVAGGETIAVTLATYRDHLASDQRDRADLLLVTSSASSAATAAAIKQALPRLHVFSIDHFIARFDRHDFSYFRQISFVLAAVTTFFAFFLITTLLTVSVNQRLGEVAALRALGFSRRRVALDLIAESALFVALGGVASVPLGLIFARSLDSILRQIPGLPARLHFFVIEPRAFLLLATILITSALLAAAYPVWIATRLPIATTLRKEVL